MSIADKAEMIEEDRQATLQYMLANERGRMFIWDMLTRTQVFGASFTGDALTTAFNEGRRDAGIRLLSDVLAHDPHALARMTVENEARIVRYHVIQDERDNDE